MKTARNAAGGEKELIRAALDDGVTLEEGDRSEQPAHD
jgi:hypothetical protein